MSTYARVEDGAVVETFTPPPNVPINECFHSDLEWVDCSATAGVAAGWTFNGGTFAPPPAPPAPSLAQQADAAMAEGLTIEITGALTLTATFPTDPQTQIKLQGVVTGLTATGGFPGGAATYPMRDTSGAWHNFTVDQYKAVGSAILNYCSALYLIIDGNPQNATALPPSTVSITV